MKNFFRNLFGIGFIILSLAGTALGATQNSTNNVAAAGLLTGSTLASNVLTSSLTTVGTIGTGTWQGTILDPAYGGTGVANNTASTITISGSHPLTLTLTGTTGVTLPTSGTLVNSGVTTLSSLASVGTITSGTWQGTPVGVVYGGTGLATLTANNVMLGNGTSTPQFIAPGTSGNVLTSNGTTWTSTAGGGGGVTSAYQGNGYNPGFFYFGGFARNNAGTANTLTADRMYLYPFLVTGPTTTFTKIGFRCSGSDGAGSTRLGIYQMAAGLPTTLILDAGTVSLASTGDKEITISQSLSSGSYALAYLSNSSSAQVNYPDIEQHFLSEFWGTSTSQAQTYQAPYLSTAYGGGLPSPFSGSITDGGNATIFPTMWLRK